jgi:hypothetical protein
VPRAYDILGPTKEWKGEKTKNKEIKKGKCNTKQNTLQNTFFQKIKFRYKPTCEVGSVWEEHISQSVSS